VPPRVVYAPEAVYPKPALDAGIEADVLLKVTVGSDGAVSDAEVVESVGDGFDEAATAAVERFVFTPAQRNGRSIAAVTSYLYRFRLPTPAEPEASTDELTASTAPSPVAAVGLLEGRVLVTGPEVPLAGAVVRVT